MLAARTKCYKYMKTVIKDPAILKEIRDNLQSAINHVTKAKKHFGNGYGFKDETILQHVMAFDETPQGYPYWAAVYQLLHKPPKATTTIKLPTIFINRRV